MHVIPPALHFQCLPTVFRRKAKAHERCAKDGSFSSAPALLTCSSQAVLFTLFIPSIPGSWLPQGLCLCSFTVWNTLPHAFASISGASFRFMLNCHFLRNAFLSHSSPTLVKLSLLVISSNSNLYHRCKLTIDLSGTCL